jgi:preprotein translocase subunit Sss1
MYWRAMKIKILVGLVVVGLIGFIIFIVIQKVRGK